MARLCMDLCLQSYRANYWSHCFGDKSVAAQPFITTIHSTYGVNIATYDLNLSHGFDSIEAMPLWFDIHPINSAHYFESLHIISR